jgi:ribonuclease E
VKNDRARVQIGKISQFGLMEMSRQRLRAGVIAGSTVTCPHCAGTGLMRSTESTALRVLRGLEDEGEKNRAAAVIVKISSDVALYILNQKRAELSRIENEHGMAITFLPTEGMVAGNFEIERTKSRDPGDRPRPSAVSIEAGFVPSDEPEPEYEEEAEEEELEAVEDEVADGEDAGEAQSFERSEGQREGREGSRRRRRRGGRGRGRERGERPQGQQAPVEAAEGASPEAPESDDAAAPEQQNDQSVGENGESARRKRRRRRGRRGGREQRGERPEPEGIEHHQTGFVSEADRFGTVPDEIDTTPSDAKHAPGTPSAPVWSLQDDIPDTTPKEEETAKDDGRPKKKGWWQRTFSGE